MSIRTFICIDFPDDIVKEITRIQGLIEKQHITGKITEPENLHLTLKFLGEIDKEKIKATQKALSKLKFPILNLRLDSIGTFSYGINPKIAWAKILGNVFGLQKEIDKALTELFPKEERFMSHVTLARIKHVSDREGFKKYLSRIKPKKVNFQCSSFKIKSSILKPEGPTYETLEEYALG